MEPTTPSESYGIGHGHHRTRYPIAQTRRTITLARAALIDTLVGYPERLDAGYTVWHRNPQHHAPIDVGRPPEPMTARNLVAIADGERPDHVLCGPCVDVPEVRAQMFELGDELSWLETADDVLGPDVDTGPWDRTDSTDEHRSFATAGILAVLLASASEGHHPSAASAISEVTGRLDAAYHHLVGDAATRFRADVDILRRRPDQWAWNVKLHGDVTLTDLVTDPDAHFTDPDLVEAVTRAVHHDWAKSCWVFAGSPVWAAALREDCAKPDRTPALLGALAPLFAGSSPFPLRERVRVLPNRSQLLVRIPATFQPDSGRSCTLVGGTLGNQPADRVLTALRLDEGVVRHNHHGATIAALEAAEL